MKSIDVNYKNIKRYKTAKYPIRQPKLVTYIIWLLSKIMLMGKKYKIEKVNMEGLKPPYMLLSNHQYFVDFELISLATAPHRVNNVVTIDGYYRRPWLMELIGAICTRKFTLDLHLIKSISKVLKRGDVLCMYPEARYSPDGTTAYLPESIGKLIKMNKVPVVVAKHHGNHLHTPFWNYRNPRKVPMHTVLTQILSAEDIKNKSVAEINELLNKEFSYNEYEYQKKQAILITEPTRAEGLHKILYKCPNCHTEHNITSSGAKLFCPDCEKSWTLLESGELVADSGETEFSSVPEWFAWERQEVIKEINEGSYSFSDEVEVYSLPHPNKFIPLGKALFTHDINEGLTLSGEYNGEKYYIKRAPLESVGLHIEYDYCYIKPLDCIDISTENDSFYCYPTKTNVVTKLSFAVEELYRHHKAKVSKESKVKK